MSPNPAVLTWPAPVVGGGGGPIFSDDFNRANGAAGNGWTDMRGAWEIRSNGMANISGATHLTVYNSVTLPDDQWAECDLLVMDSRWGGVGCRASSSTPDFYFFGYDVDNSRWTLARRVGSGGYVDMNTAAAATPSTPVTVRIEAEGTTIRGYVNGVLTATATDSSYTSGHPALYSRDDSTTPHFDNFSAGAL